MDKVQHWGVHVHINGENVLSIESNSLSGIENIGDYEDTVRGCAYHLLSFIGGDSNFRAVSDELTRLRAEVERLKAEPDFKKMTAMSKLTSAVQMVSYCNGLEQENADLKAEVERLRGDGWISVKERLPDKNIAVIVHISSGDIDVRVFGICDDDPNGLWYCCKGADEPLRFNEVTHWRPLPEPPRGENGENNEI